MKSRNAFDETRTPFLLEALEALGTDLRETDRQDERSADHECECGRHSEAAASDEALEAEDGYEMEDEDETGPADAFERYQAADGEAAWESEMTDETEDPASEWEDIASEWESAPTADESEAETQDFAEAIEADGMLETEEEAPELAYDVQENEDETAFLDETEAPQVEAQVPAQAPVALSNGEFGRALAVYARNAGLPNAVSNLLKQSPAFMAIVKALDGKYLHLHRPSGIPEFWGDAFGAKADGVFTKGPHVGRRMVLVQQISEGTSFRPFGSPDNHVAADMVLIETPSSRLSDLDRRGLWLERIVHESIHAHRHVLGLRRSGSTPGARIRAALDDEVATRQQEGAVVADLRARFPGFRRYQPTTGSTIRAAIERDFFPGDLRLSYLESFVLGERLEAARQALEAAFRPNRRSSTAGAEISAYDAFVDRIPLEKRPLSSYLVADPAFMRPDRDQLARFHSEYPRIRLIRRIIDARWRSLAGLDRRDVHRDAHIEKMRQEHAQAFFAGLASYSPLP